ncbi:MAG: hypothetical protein AABY07_01090 [Nanoarchaeota archaeon]
MAQVNLGQRFPFVYFSDEEHLAIKEYVELILAKKKHKGELIDRITSEMGESAVDLLLEKLNLDRMWMRGRFHFDFCNRDCSIRLEVKTRKRYCNNFDDLDVRLDFWEYEAATEATHIVPVVYDPLDEGAKIITPGVLSLDNYVNGIRKYKDIIPKTRALKHGCFRVPWKIVFEHPSDFGYFTWDEFKDRFKV